MTGLAYMQVWPSQFQAHSPPAPTAFAAHGHHSMPLAPGVPPFWAQVRKIAIDLVMYNIRSSMAHTRFFAIGSFHDHDVPSDTFPLSDKAAPVYSPPIT
jgi:hypothetical protein